MSGLSRYVIASIYILAILTGCSDLKEQDNSEVALVGEKAILTAQLIERLSDRSKGLNAANLTEQQKLYVLNDMIEREVQIAVARLAGYETELTIVAAVENLLINKLRSEQLDKLLADITISQADVENYFQQNLQKYTTPAMTRLAIVRLSLSSQANSDKQADVKARAEQAYALALKLPYSVHGFGSLAAKYSDHQATRYAGGDLGWIKNDNSNKQIDDAVVAAMTNLNETDKMAPLVKGADGYYLVKLLDRRALKQQSLEQVGSNIQRILEREKRKSVEADWLLSLRKNIEPVEVNQAVLAGIQIPANLQSQSAQSLPPKLPNK
jgi:parvulin-like peptidyl-prolyl isomerase